MSILQRVAGQRSPSITDTISLTDPTFDLTGCSSHFRMRLDGSSTLAIDEAETVNGTTPPPNSTASTTYNPSVSYAALATGIYEFWHTVTLSGGLQQDTPEQLIYLSQHAPALPVVASAGTLTTLDRALAWLRRSHATGQTFDDDLTILPIIMAGVTQAIVRYTGREFFDPTGNNADLARTFEYLGGGFLNLAPYDLRAITSITLGGETLTATTGDGDGDYVPMPRNQTREGTWLYFTMRSFYSLGPTHFIYSPVLKTRDVIITGKWGMPTVPADVERACLIAIEDSYHNPGQAEQRGQGDFQIVEAPRDPGSGGLPDATIDLIEPYRRIVF